MNPRSCCKQAESGFALPSTLMLLLLLMTMGGAAALYAGLEFRALNHFQSGNQALLSAEAGALRAVNVMNQTGVTHFGNDIVARWHTLFNPSVQSIAGYSQFTFSASVQADPANPADRGWITATGWAPYNARRSVRIGVKRGPIGRGSGAIYLAADSVSPSFSGNAFDIDGNNHDPYGNLLAGTVAPGIATRNDTVTNAVKSALNTQQKDNVRGSEFSLSPLNPSVVTTGGPDWQDLNRIVNQVLQDPRVVRNNSSRINGNVTFGTLAAPQITYLTASQVTIHANGNASGAGILVVDGSLTINGNLNFVGWIIVRGSTVISGPNSDDETTVLGNATVMGSLWTAHMTIRVGGSAIVNFCESCLNMIVPPSGGGYMPKAMMITSWQEVL
ncbi:MAG: hypothetical protein N3C12_04995 [Candidatus Binatia bacterium]|nr:hypothetical protein [Candidatus Binatia bacterium]